MLITTLAALRRRCTLRHSRSVVPDGGDQLLLQNKSISIHEIARSTIFIC